MFFNTIVSRNYSNIRFINCENTITYHAWNIIQGFF